MRALPASGRRTVRRAARVAVALLVAGQVVGVAPPAAAAPTPWRFMPPMTFEFSVPANSVGSGVGNCPDLYIPVAGGLQSITPAGSGFERVAEYRQGARGYQVVVHNYTAGAITARVGIACALESNVGTLQYVSAVFDRDADGDAGGTVTCPSGTMALIGGADWSTFNTNRRVDLTSPTPDGRGWYTAGWSGVAGSLGVEAYCVAAADLGVAAPQVATVDIGSTTDVPRQGSCPAGLRIASGGVLASVPGGGPDPYTYHAHTDFSSPHGTVGTPVWTTATHVLGGTRLTYVLWCLPVSRPTVAITQAPPANTSSTSATIAWQASDPAGEALSWSCLLDGVGVGPCGPSSPYSANGLAEGPHTFQATVYNNSKESATDSRTWKVDLTAPDAVAPPAGPSVSGPLAVTFSEPVAGVTTSSMQVRVAGLSSIVPGSIVMSTTGSGGSVASWVPTAPLVPGETYAITLTSGVKDLAGNPLAGETFLVRTSRVVQNTSAALHEYWDPDTSASASGGAYAVSGVVGSSASWRFTATSGQTAAVYGTRLAGGGYGDVYLDGVKKATASFYAAATAWKSKVWTSPALSAGTHTVEVRVLGTKPGGSAGTDVALDYLTVGSSVLQESAAHQAFRRLLTATTQASGGSYDLVSHKTSGDTGEGPTYRVTVKSTGLRLFATKTPSAGTVAVYVDGVLKATVSLRTPDVHYQQLVYAVSGLSEGRHAVRVVCVGTSSGAYSSVSLDYLIVT